MLLLVISASCIIEKKRDGYELTTQEINWFIEGVIKNKIDDSQLSSLLMSIYFRGMSNKVNFWTNI